MTDGSAHELATFQRRLRACRACVDAGYLPDAAPVFRGAATRTRMIVGQAPGARGHERGVPWSGPSGQLLRGWLARAGFAGETFLDDWYFTSVTKCFPGPAAGGGDRVPSRAEQVLCAPWLEGELILVRPSLIVTLGRLATTRFVPATRRLPLAAIIGQRWTTAQPWGDVPVIPLPHPSGVSRWLNAPANRALVDQALALLAQHNATPQS